jgi:hypothetical protein
VPVRTATPHHAVRYRTGIDRDSQGETGRQGETGSDGDRASVREAGWN